MSQTASTAFAAAITFTVQKTVLQNLRDSLVWADSDLAQKGTFNAMSDQVMFTAIPDLSNTTPQTPLTEGSAPTARALTFSTVVFSTAEYGDVVNVTNVAKLKGPQGIIDTAVERETRVAGEVMDVITRDTIFTGGTWFGWTSTTHTNRAALDSSDKITGALLIKLHAKMKKAKIPAYPDGSYRLMLGTSTAFDLKSETTATTSWAETHKYVETGVAALDNNRVGRLHGFEVYEVNTAPSFSSTTTVEAGIAHGPIKGWGTGDLDTLTNYHVSPGGDHSDVLAQIEAVGWRVNFGVGVLNNSYYFRVEGFGASIT